MLRFANPEYFRLLWLILVLIICFPLSIIWRKRALLRFGNLALWQIPSLSRWRRWLKFLLIILVMILLTISLARPQIGSKQIAVRRVGFNIIFVLDTSKSMLAEDIEPNRLERAKSELRVFVSKLQNDNVGLVTFAGSAYLQVPLTCDYAALNMFLNDIDTNIIPEPGTAIAQALEVARQAFRSSKQKTKIVILVTDGEEHSGQALATAKVAAKDGIKIYVVGVGTPQGNSIPLRSTDGNIQGYKKDRQGNVVISRLNRKVLQEIAQVAGGKYLELADDNGLSKVYKEIQLLSGDELKAQGMQQYGERYTFFLLLALLLLVVESIIAERRSTNKDKYRKL